MSKGEYDFKKVYEKFISCNASIDNAIPPLEVLDEGLRLYTEKFNAYQSTVAVQRGANERIENLVSTVNKFRKTAQEIIAARSALVGEFPSISNSLSFADAALKESQAFIERDSSELFVGKSDDIAENENILSDFNAFIEFFNKLREVAVLIRGELKDTKPDRCKPVLRKIKRSYQELNALLPVICPRFTIAGVDIAHVYEQMRKICRLADDHAKFLKDVL